MDCGENTGAGVLEHNVHLSTAVLSSVLDCGENAVMRASGSIMARLRVSGGWKATVRVRLRARGGVRAIARAARGEGYGQARVMRIIPNTRNRRICRWGMSERYKCQYKCFVAR